MNTEQTKQFISNLFHIWKTGGVDKADQFYAPDVTLYVNNTESYGLNEIKNRMNFISENHENPTFDLLHLLVDGDKASVLVNYSCLNKKNNENIFAPTAGVYHFKNDKISEVWLLSSAPINYLETP